MCKIICFYISRENYNKMVNEKVVIPHQINDNNSSDEEIGY
jgi:hypothetical protein